MATELSTTVMAIDLIRLDGNTQPRAKIDEDTVADYAAVWTGANGSYPFDKPCEVFHDGTDYWCTDGFHRILGAQRAKKASIPCIVHKGTVRDAIVYGAKCNSSHGLRRSAADKRHVVSKFLKDDEWSKRSSRWIAEVCNVSHVFVSTVRTELEPAAKLPNVSGGNVSNSPPKRVGSTEGKDRKQYKSQKKSTPTPSEPAAPDYGKCPNCGGSKWTSDDDGVNCSKCHHPHGEPAGHVDDGRVRDLRSKTVKTTEALMRAFDELNHIASHPKEHAQAITTCKILLKTAKEWK